MQAIFLPGRWMKAQGENELVVMELESATCPAKVPTSARAIRGN